MAGDASAKKEDPLAHVKAQLDGQMRRVVYERFAPLYEGSAEFSDCRFAALVPCGTNQSFTGLARNGANGPNTPHGWGVLEHHEGFSQACAMWRDGVADGAG